MKKILSISLAVIIFLSLNMAFASNNINVYEIYNAYENLNDTTLLEFADCCVRYFGLSDIEFAENVFTDVQDESNILKLVKMGCVNGNGDGTVGANDVVGEQRASVILGRLNKLVNRQKESSDGLVLADKTTLDMTNAEYWISKTPDAYEKLLDKEQIAKINQDIIDGAGTKVFDIKQMKDVIDTKSLAKSMSEFEAPNNLFLDDKKADQSYWKKIKRNIANASVSKKTSVKYGVIVNRTNVKGYPTSDILTDDVNDPEWNEIASTSLLVNEPVIEYFKTADNKFSYVIFGCGGGWVESENIAYFTNKNDWIKAWDFEDFIVVTGNRVFLEPSICEPDVSYKQLTMGTKLELVTDYNGTDLVLSRVPQDNYIVKLPMRDKKGKYYSVNVPIPKNREVNVGYLDFTRANILKTAFNCLGDHYGWGGMMQSVDCSEFVQMVYRCMGVYLPRNTTWQANIPNDVTKLTELSAEEKAEMIDNLTPGTILQFTGHEMLYLGKVGDEYYTINTLGTIYTKGIKKRVRGVIVNTLTTQRASGNTWYNDIDTIIDITK